MDDMSDSIEAQGKVESGVHVLGGGMSFGFSKSPNGSTHGFICDLDESGGMVRVQLVSISA